MYRDLISDTIGKVHEAGVATKILQYMNKIRNESDITQARRWVMELLQNARDLAWEGKPLRVQIELRDDALFFRHSGKPFGVEDILSIVNQVSSKNPGEGVGQFGTGFMTTYQLSEKVEIHSYLKEENIPGKEFRVTLDRTGHGKEEILKAITHNIDQLKRADELPDAEEHEWGVSFDTEFCYLLETERSRGIARTGVTDLADTILYVMLFSEKIGSVELSVDIEGKRDTITYRRGEHGRRSEHIEELTVIEERPDGQIQHKLFFMRDNGLTLAAEYDPERGFLPISERTPRIFKDFPLIGAERFPFPVVINDRDFSPNEPRSGISLVDNAESLDAKVNKEIMLLAVKDHGIFVNELVQIDIRGAQNLIGIFEYQDNKEWSESWVKENLYNGVYRTIKELPIFPTVSGNMSLSDDELYIIRSECSDDNEEKEDIKRLTAPLRKYSVPNDETDWYKVLEPYQFPEEKCIDLDMLIKKAPVLMKNSLDRDMIPVLEWNCRLLEAAMKNPEISVEIKAGNISIFPNQDPKDQEWCNLFSARQIYRDPGIPEVLKDVAETVHELDRLSARNDYPMLRSILLPREFRLTDESILREYPLSNVTEYIRERCNRTYRVIGYQTNALNYNSTWQKAWFMMLACGPDDEMYELCGEWYEEKLPERNKIEDERITDYLWRTTYCSVLEYGIMAKIETFSKLQDFKTDPPYKWLNIFYKKCLTYLRDVGLNGKKIFPDQEGKLTDLWSLSKDSIQEEELKEIALCFESREPSCNMYRELLDRSVVLDGWSVSEKADKDVAGRINNVVQTLLMECSLSQAELIYQEACTRLLGWIEEHLAYAKEYFPAFCKEEDQMKLLTPKAAASMHKKAKDYAKLMEILGTKDPVEMEKLVTELKESSRQPENTEEHKSFHEGTGMWLDEELMAMDSSEQDRACREIGTAGELYVFEMVREALLERGFVLTSESPQKLVFSGEGPEYIVYRPDTDGYHQAGWDIMITKSSPSTSEKTDWYLEVKTHTPGSVNKGILHVSSE